MSIYDRQVASAKRMIAKYGETATLTQTTIGIPNPDKPWEQAPDTATDYTPKIVFFPANELQYRTLQTIQNTEVPTEVTVGYMANVAFKLGMNDIVKRRNGDVLRIIHADIIDPNGDGPILHTIYFRK